MADTTVSLTIGGDRHEGWHEVRVTRSIDALTGSFSLMLADSWAARKSPFPVEAGARCTLSIGGETVITGHVDRVNPRVAGDDHTIQVVGRDLAADLVDCAAIAPPGSWRAVPMAAIVRQIVAPFGLTVTMTVQDAPVRMFALQPGDTAHAAIERLLRFRGLIAISLADGSIALTSPDNGAPAEVLELGANLIDAEAAFDVTERFSEVIVKGQAAGDDRAHGRSVSAGRGRAVDPAVTRYRPLILIAEDQALAGGLEARAKWEVSTRAARGQSVRLVAQGWHRADGRLRTHNSMISIRAPMIAVDGPMLIESISYVLGSDGTTTEMVAVPRDAWTQLPVAEPSAARIGKVRA
ncbi:MAG: phage baseplate assembly protein [Pseudomonadota bacterium]